MISPVGISWILSSIMLCVSLTVYECPSSLCVRGASTLTGASALLDTGERVTIIINNKIQTKKDKVNQAV